MPAPRSVFLRMLARALRTEGAGLEPGARLLVGVSGGADSTALATGLARLAPPRGLRLTLAHVHHGLRGAAADADAAAVQALATRLGVDAVERRIAVAPGPGLEARARRARHAALQALARECGAVRVVLAHTRDDQAETFLLRLLRGSGRGGLGAMRPRRGRLWRPLLAVTRADVRRFLTDEDLPCVLDASNADLRHLRNRVRRLVLPFLAAELNPRLAAGLADLARRLADEDALLVSLAAARATALRDAAGLHVAVAAEPPALARRIIRGWLEAGQRAGVGAVHVERVLALAAHGTPGTIAIPGAARVVLERDRLVRRAGRAPTPRRYRVAIAPGVSVEPPGASWRLSLSAPRPWGPERRLPPDARAAVFDADVLPAGLEVRSVRPGDRIHLLGVGTRKVQDVLVDAKVPREARADVPLLAAEDCVLWVAGVARSSAALVGPKTCRVVEAEVVPSGASALPL
jgi:tRNA(Ile)-lysidine synthase